MNIPVAQSKIKRERFTLDRQLEFFSKSELTQRIGNDIDDWLVCISLIRFFSVELSTFSAHVRTQFHPFFGSLTHEIREKCTYFEAHLRQFSTDEGSPK